MTYTVDEVSDLLDVPRPTLYRYLREYSIPHLRRSGKIYVPKESFDRIKEVRELHKEGLATESVHRRLEEEGNLDIEELTERLDRIWEALERLQGNLKPANGASSAHVLQTILARQNELISAVSNLTERLENLPYINAHHTKVLFFDPEEETQQDLLVEQFETSPEVVKNEPIIETSSNSTRSPTTPARPRRFGAMGRRRRRGALSVLLVLLASAALVIYAALSEESPGASQEGAFTQETASAGSEESPSRGLDSAPSDSATSNEEKSTGYPEEGYQGFAREQPFYQKQYPTQDVAPELPSQEQPVLQPPSDSTGLPHLTFGNDDVQSAPGVPTP